MQINVFLVVAVTKTVPLQVSVCFKKLRHWNHEITVLTTIQTLVIYSNANWLIAFDGEDSINLPRHQATGCVKM